MWKFSTIIPNGDSVEQDLNSSRVDLSQSTIILTEKERVIEVMSRWYGISRPSEDFLVTIGRGSLSKGEALWLNMIGFTAVSIYCGALEMSIRDKKSLNPDYDKERIRSVRENLEPTINYLASNINLLKFKGQIIEINEIFSKLISHGFISFAKLQSRDTQPPE